MIKHDMIIFLEDLKNLLQETELDEKENVGAGTQAGVLS